MGKANLAQEKRIMLFEEVYGARTERRLTQEEATELLGGCPRTFRRWAERWEEDGLDGLRDRRVSGASHRAAPVDEVMRMVGRYRTSSGSLRKQAMKSSVKYEFTVHRTPFF